jgi:hypothetical protein
VSRMLSYSIPRPLVERIVLAFMGLLLAFQSARPNAPPFPECRAFGLGALDGVLKISCRKLRFCGIMSHGVDFW